MRRLRVDLVTMGQIELGEREAHHARDVLRLAGGAEVEVFDGQGRVGIGKIESAGKKVVVKVEAVEEPAPGFEWWVAAALPKGTRGDWMVEKLSELGASGFVPLITERSVVSAEGKNKRQRWERLANEAARQSRRRGIMKIREVTHVAKMVGELRGKGWYLSLHDGAKPIRDVLGDAKGSSLTLFIGPEGGWTEQEIGMFDKAGLTGVRMGGSILRVETAAVAAGAIVAAMVVEELNH
jgi:16S rRNA (uracil1498-N3)-methyltransferase